MRHNKKSTKAPLEVLTAALQDAGILVLQHEGLNVGCNQAVHVLSLLQASSLHQTDQHIQGPLHKNAAVAVGVGNDGSQDWQNACLQRDMIFASWQAKHY